jgi:hypothetical protein
MTNGWCEIGDRDVFGCINHMQSVVAGVWDYVKHQTGHVCVEGRKTDAREWTDEKWCNVEADRVCGRIWKMVLKDELEWLGKVDGWSVKHRELEGKYDIIPERLEKDCARGSRFLL